MNKMISMRGMIVPEMTPERWERVEEVLSAVIDLDPAARQAILDEVCTGDAALRAQVESLLEFDTGAEVAVSGVIKGSLNDYGGTLRGLPPGSTIGPYRIVREVGRGGMGTVYLAERGDGQFQMRVAIKLVTKGMDTAALLVRFRHERQILARLEHPCIARLLDGGSTTDGRPFLVMEYVEGQSITAYCAAKTLAIRDRILLFRQVCSAVQCAHQNLVVHRDLKPGNILVAQDGTPKLLDFGIAKLMGPDEATSMTVVQPGLSVLTPDYGSPEQLRGTAITTAADIYALGAILYELLSGVRPHRFLDSSRDELERVICQEMPVKPSEAGTSPKGDLDNIILMAMQKEPARRYATAAELSEDLQRYLDGLPIRARKDTVRYRTGKFVQRHRAGVIAGILVLASLVGGVTFSLIQGRRAERRFADLRGLAHAVLYDIHDSITDLPGSVKAREIVVKTALRYLDGLAKESGNDPDIRLELAEAYLRVGDVQGAPVQRSLGQTGPALESYNKALALLEELPAGTASSEKGLAVRMNAYVVLGDMAARRGNDLAKAISYMQRGIHIGESARDKLSWANQRILANLYVSLAREENDSAKSIASASKAMVMLERINDEFNKPETGLELAEGYSMLGTAYLRANDLQASLEYLKKAAEVRKLLVEAFPMNARYERQLMISYSKIADIYGPVLPSLRDPQQAVATYEKVIQIADKLAAADPSDLRAAFDRGMAREKAAQAFGANGNPERPLQTIREARGIFQGIAAKDPKDKSPLVQLWYLDCEQVARLSRAGRAAEAVSLGREAIRRGVQLTAANPKNLTLHRSLLHLYEHVLEAMPRAQKAEAIAYAEKCIAVAQAARNTDKDNAVTQALLPEAYAKAGAAQAKFASSKDEWTRARDWFEKSAAGWEQIHPKNGWPDNRDSELAHVRAEAARCATKL